MMNLNKNIKGDDILKISQAHSIQGVSKDREENDFYPTPPNAVHELLKREKFEGLTWECACGDGAISKVLEEYGLEVYSSDLIDRGYGDVGIDFLNTYKKVDNIITNPPYKYATEFVQHALTQANKKVAMLLKIQFLEGVKRYELFKTTPLKKVYVFSQRLKIYKNGIQQKNSTMMCFAWFVWEHGYKGEPIIDWIKE